MERDNRMIPRGFRFSTAAAAIKRHGRKDLALIVSEGEAVMSGMFTTNKVKAAPVRLDMRRIRSGKGRAIIVNSGNANACTGKQGMRDAIEMTGLVAGSLGLKSNEVYPCSTGVIGRPLPMERIRPKVIELAGTVGGALIHDVAAAIMTTDTFPKTASKRVRIGNKTVTIAGVCKGAGMICPHMATMLCFLLTDIRITPAALDEALRQAVQGSFNGITVDGDRSTNDTVLIMANGLAGNNVVTQGSSHFKTFTSALSTVAAELSELIVRDGEGATKLVEVVVRRAKGKRDAERAAFSIANSLLVKTALYGNDVNWGRIMAALGYSGIALKEEMVDIYFGPVKVVNKGLATEREEEAAEFLRKKEVTITVDLHLGNDSARVLTCDLTEDYVRINAEYRT